MNTRGFELVQKEDLTKYKKGAIADGIYSLAASNALKPRWRWSGDPPGDIDAGPQRPLDFSIR